MAERAAADARSAAEMNRRASWASHSATASNVWASPDGSTGGASRSKDTSSKNENRTLAAIASRAGHTQQGYVAPRIALAGQRALRAGIMPGQGLHICGGGQLLRREWRCEAWRRFTGRRWGQCSREWLRGIFSRRRKRGCGAERVGEGLGSVRVRLVVAQRGRAGAEWQQRCTASAQVCSARCRRSSGSPSDGGPGCAASPIRLISSTGPSKVL